MTIYLDTNFFLYFANKDSDYYADCALLIKECQKNSTHLTTSVETIQEIIHYSKNIKQIELGLETARLTLEIVDSLLSVSGTTITIYLNQASHYLNPSSRDLLHLAVCLENKIEIIISFDKDFNRFKDLKRLEPKDLISKL